MLQKDPSDTVLSDSTTMNLDWEKILRQAAFQGKNAILENYNPESRRETLGQGVGGDQTLRIDEASEIAIHASLDQALGVDSYIFLSEEIGEIKCTDDEPKPVVICDPLDGSHNAQVGLPFFAVSLSVLGIRRRLGPNERRTFSDVDAAFILSVPTSDEFSSLKKMGAFHNGSRLKERSQLVRRLETLLVECGDVEYLKQIAQKFSNDYIYKTRILGSAALSFCYLADGTADGFVFTQPGGARTIDSPAGYLIAREAGCVFADLSGKDQSIENVEIGFHSRVGIAGACNGATLSRLLAKIR
ncbi:MAG: inositol monophosphatase family protein [Nitrososphaerales archaeon]